MKLVKDLTDIPLLEIMLDFSIGGHTWDLHNDFDCKEISLENQNLVFSFENETSMITFEMAFHEVEILGSVFEVTRNDKSIILENFQRSRYQIGEELFDETESGKHCYLIEFDEGQSIELLSKKVELSLIEKEVPH